MQLMTYWITIALMTVWVGLIVWTVISRTDAGWIVLVISLFLLVCLPLYYLLSEFAARLGFIALNLLLLGVVLFEARQGASHKPEKESINE